MQEEENLHISVEQAEMLETKGYSEENRAMFKPEQLTLKASKVGVFVDKLRKMKFLDKIDKRVLRVFKFAWNAMLLCGIALFVIFALNGGYGHNPLNTDTPNGELLVYTGFAIFVGIFVLCQKSYSSKVYPLLSSVQWSDKTRSRYKTARKHIRTLIVVALLIGAFITIGKSMLADITVVKPVVFLFSLLTVLYMTSEFPQFVRWTTVLSGLLLQFFIGFIVLRTTFGGRTVSFLANKVKRFMSFASHGAEFTFGSELVEIGTFVITVFPLIIYFGAVTNLLYYLNFVQPVIAGIATVLCSLVGTSAIETVNTAANIFLGMSETPLLIKPFLQYTTDSELFVIMTGGFASIAGSVFGAFIDLKAPETHLLTACIMSAPGSLALSKLAFPERMRTAVDIRAIRHYKSGSEYVNWLDAILSGARTALSICGAVLAALISMISILKLADGACSWLFAMFNRPDVDIQFILAHLFYPITFMLGIRGEDSLVAGRLLGLKTILNEFIAFQKLGSVIKDRNSLIANGTFTATYCDPGSVYRRHEKLMLWHERSIVVMTYALCGFSNIASLAIVLGCLSVLAPSKKDVFTKHVVKALFVAISVNLVTAALASCFYESANDNYSLFNCTKYARID